MRFIENVKNELSKTTNSFQGMTEELSNMLRIKSRNYASSNNILMMVSMEGHHIETVDISMIVEAPLQKHKRNATCCHAVTGL
jgi:hypothetical protein